MRLCIFVPVILAFLVAAPAGAQDVQEHQVEYSARTGAVRGIPLVAGQTYTIQVVDLNPLCYAYSAELSVREENADLSRIIATFGSFPATTAGASPGTPPTNTPRPPPPPPPPPPAVVPLTPDTTAEETPLEQAREAFESATRDLDVLRSQIAAIEGLVGQVKSPACSRNASFTTLAETWDRLGPERARLRSHGAWRLDGTRKRLAEAKELLGSLPAGSEAAGLRQEAVTATEETDRLARKLAALLPELAIAEGTMASAVSQQDFRTQVFLPAGASAAEITVKATELKPEKGKTASTTEQKSSLPIRRGMRIFLSIGYMASTARSNDYERANRPCPEPATFTCETVYSTYVNRLPGQGFAFSPVLQVNVAFRDVLRSGVSLHTSAGVATRSVNGSSSPEFILGAGTGFMDRFLVTTGVHLARDETLLLGDPTEVRQRPVSDKITTADAVSVVWRPAFVTTVTLRL
ncbi:MAG TPA: hypothetical protein VFQ45_08065 [Longimicrobium sp.]|nr:hypothetical protein [Longimicrobium sp.]